MILSPPLRLELILTQEIVILQVVLTFTNGSKGLKTDWCTFMQKILVCRKAMPSAERLQEHLSGVPVAMELSTGKG